MEKYVNETRDLAEKWFKENYPEEYIGKFRASKFYFKEYQWWFTKYQYDLSNKGEFKMFLQKKINENDFYYLKIPFLFFQENWKNFPKNKKNKEGIDIRLYRRKEGDLIDINSNLSFTEFIVDPDNLVDDEEKPKIENEIQTGLNNSLNQIFYGPPGTGKTYSTIEEAVKIIFGSDEFKEFKEEENRKAIREEFDELKKEGKIAFVTFHQSYGYEEFVEGIKPVSKDNGQVGYEVCAGIFKQMCEKASEDKNSNYVLIIDEINRGNISKIFGELITLIEEDKRLDNDEEMTVKLPYSSTFNKNDNNKEFGVPNNLYIIGTMNTADRSLVLLDTALRRRFCFVEIMPNYKILKDIVVEGVDIAEMLKVINERIKDKGSREQQIGHSYFLQLKGEETIEKLAKIFQRQILPLLEEYFFENRKEVAEILNNNGFYENGELDLEKLKTAESYKKIYEEKKGDST